MDWDGLSSGFSNLWAGVTGVNSDWELILRFLDVLVWPVFALVALVATRPWRLVDAVLANGGELGAGPMTVRISSRIEDAAEAVLEEPDAAAAPAISEAELQTADPYKRIMDSWGKLSDEIYRAVGPEDVAQAISRREPGRAIDALFQRKLIGRRLAKGLRELLDVRNQVKRYGRAKFQRMRFSDEDVETFVKSALRAAGTIRERHERSRGMIRPPNVSSSQSEPVH